MKKSWTEIKAVLSDLDGTIVRDDNEMSIETVETIRKLQQRELLFLPVTGRCYEDVKPLFQKHNISCPFILLNGAQYCDVNGKLVLCDAMDKMQAKEILAILKQQQMSIGIYAGLAMFSSKGSKSLEEEYQEISPGILRGVKDFEENKAEKLICKIEAMHRDLKKLKKCRKELLKIPSLEVTSSMSHNIEVTREKVTKAAMAQKVLALWGIKREEVLLFGDSLNDLSLFESFQHTVAVENACKEIKMIATYQCESCKNNGFSEFLKNI